MELQAAIPPVEAPRSRTLQAIRQLLRNLPGVPRIIQNLKDQRDDQQRPPQGNRPVEADERPGQTNPPNQAQQDIQSPPEPDTTSNSTQVDSLGFENHQTSSISQPPSELVASPIKPSQAVVFDERVFVAPHVEMDPEASAKWETEIYERLSKALEDTGRGVVSLQAGLTSVT